jgi:hypothetical protein
MTIDNLCESAEKVEGTINLYECKQEKECKHQMDFPYNDKIYCKKHTFESYKELKTK